MGLRIAEIENITNIQATKLDSDSNELEELLANLRTEKQKQLKDRNKHTTSYVVPLISATRSFTEAYTTLNLDYLICYMKRKLKLFSLD